MFKLELWEAGSGITGRFENLEQMDNPDAVVFIFSSLDRNSFDSLPDLIQQINSEGKWRNFCLEAMNLIGQLSYS